MNSEAPLSVLLAAIARSQLELEQLEAEREQSSPVRAQASSLISRAGGGMAGALQADVSEDP